MTMKLLRSARSQEWREEIVAHSVKKMHDLLFYLIRPRPQAHEEMTRRMTELCEKALILKVRMRESQSDYSVTNFHEGSKVPSMDNKSVIVEEAEGQRLKQEDIRESKVDYTLFGGLSVRHRGIGPAIMLEKAHVVVRVAR